MEHCGQLKYIWQRRVSVELHELQHHHLPARQCQLLQQHLAVVTVAVLP